jgi:glutamine synthetase
LFDSLQAFETDPLVPEVFGTEFQQIYLKQKMKEWEKGFYRVCEEEREQMMTFI